MRGGIARALSMIRVVYPQGGSRLGILGAGVAECVSNGVTVRTARSAQRLCWMADVGSARSIQKTLFR